MNKQQGTLTARSTTTKVVEGEPAVAMFQLPAGYRKVDAAQQLIESPAAQGVGVDAAAAEQIRQRIESSRPQ